MRAQPGTPGDELKGAYVVVTGGSKGLGLETVRALMTHGCHVVMAARDMDACKSAAAQLSQEQAQGTCSCSQLNLEDFASIRRFAEEQKSELKTRKQSLQVLVNNAGVMGVGYTAAGLDRHILCNHLGPFLLTNLLIGTMKPSARIVSVASRAHSNGKLDFANGDLVMRPKSWFWRYSDSKLANVLFTAELQRRFGPTSGIKSVSVSPGLVSTNIFRNMPWPLNLLAKPVIPLFARTPKQGAETIVWAATSPQVDGSPDQLVLHDCKPARPLGVARDESLGEALWAWSERVVASQPSGNQPR